MPSATWVADIGAGMSPGCGQHDHSLGPLLAPGGDTSIGCIESAHPSPYSAQSGFFGSHPFSRANRLLEQQGAEPVDWKLP